MTLYSASQANVSITKKIIFIFKIFSAIFLLFFLYHYALAKDFLDHIVDINYNGLIFGVALTFPVIILRAKRWSLIVAENGIVMNNKTLFSVYLPSFMLGLVTPGRLGELIRCKYLCNSGLNIQTSILTFVFDRIFDIIPTILVSTVFVFYIIDKGVDARTKQLLLLIATAALFIILAFFLLSLWKRRPELSPPRRGFSYSPILIIKCGAISVYSLLISACQAYLFAFSVGLNTTIVESFGFASLSSLASQLPVGFGGIGSRDLILVYLLEQAGNNASTAFLFAQSFNITSIFLLLAGITILCISYLGKNCLSRGRNF
ncbi:MAG: flippase-like domain-containing protein [Firmicutes bacterium]|nr:flippase-like domain-containing protein [Bacillota bacterium]